MPNGFFAQLRKGLWFLCLASLALTTLSCSERDATPVAGKMAGDLSLAQAWWLAADTIAWDVMEGSVVSLHYSPEAELEIAAGGVVGGELIELTRDGEIDGPLARRFPHLAGLPAYQLSADDQLRVPAILKTQFAVSAINGDGIPLDATALQAPGVLDELYQYEGKLGCTFEEPVPLCRLWAPTARSVRLHLFDDSNPDSLPSAVLPMEPDPENGTWSVVGELEWNRKFYLYEVEVYVRNTGRIEHNLVTDPYSVSLSMDSRRSQIIDLSDADLKPMDWDTLAKPDLSAPEDIVLYELHVRDFSFSDPKVPDKKRGTFAAFGLAIPWASATCAAWPTPGSPTCTCYRHLIAPRSRKIRPIGLKHPICPVLRPTPKTNRPKSMPCGPGMRSTGVTTPTTIRCRRAVTPRTRTARHVSVSFATWLRH